jgi:hypothetical protein
MAGRYCVVRTGKLVSGVGVGSVGECAECWRSGAEEGPLLVLKSRGVAAQCSVWVLRWGLGLCLCEMVVYGSKASVWQNVCWCTVAVLVLRGCAVSGSAVVVATLRTCDVERCAVLSLCAHRVVVLRSSKPMQAPWRHVLVALPA